MSEGIDRSKFVPISRLCSEYNKLAGRGVSENTIRNYIRDYSEHFNVVHEGQAFVELIPALEVIKRIRSTISSGRNKGKYEVLESLGKTDVQNERSPCKVVLGLSGDDWDRINGIIREVVTEVVTEVVKGGQSER